MHLRTFTLFALCSTVISCGDPERSGVTDDGAVGDSTAADTSVATETGTDAKVDTPDSTAPDAKDSGGADSTVDSTPDTTPTDTGTVDTGPADTGIVKFVCIGASTESFSAKMIGCAAANVFSDRAKVCPFGSHVCSAKEWMDNRGGLAPKNHYWTNDLLKYTGPGSGNCSVSLTTGSDCGAETPMRVCNGTGTAAVTDSVGNVCNWVGCGYEAATPVLYFGGCAGNTTAGTLCCK